MEHKYSSNEDQNHHSSKSRSPPKKQADTSTPANEGNLNKDSPEALEHEEASVTAMSPANDYQNAEDEKDHEEIVMRVELEIDIADAAQPTSEEIKEYESFTSKYQVAKCNCSLINFDSDFNFIMQSISPSLARRQRQGCLQSTTRILKKQTTVKRKK